MVRVLVPLILDNNSLSVSADSATERQLIDLSDFIIPTFLLAFIAQIAIIFINSEDDGKNVHIHPFIDFLDPESRGL